MLILVWNQWEVIQSAPHISPPADSILLIECMSDQNHPYAKAVDKILHLGCKSVFFFSDISIKISSDGKLHFFKTKISC